MSAETALELAAAEFLSCGVLDVYLRDGLVFPAAEVLKQKGAGLVFYTGQADADRIKLEWLDAEVLAKPAPLEAAVRGQVGGLLARKAQFEVGTGPCGADAAIPPALIGACAGAVLACTRRGVEVISAVSRTLFFYRPAALLPFTAERFELR
jgi:hypothetical protein